MLFALLRSSLAVEEDKEETAAATKGDDSILTTLAAPAAPAAPEPAVTPEPASSSAAGLLLLMASSSDSSSLPSKTEYSGCDDDVAKNNHEEHLTRPTEAEAAADGPGRRAVLDKRGVDVVEKASFTRINEGSRKSNVQSITGQVMLVFPFLMIMMMYV